MTTNLRESTEAWGQPGLPPSPRTNENPLVTMEAEWEKCTSVPSKVKSWGPFLPTPEQCQRKAAKTEGLNKIQRLRT